jgi:transposase
MAKLVKVRYRHGVLEPFEPLVLAEDTELTIINAILYLLKTGCQWRQLPHDLPPWKTVYYHFRQWEKRGVLAQIRDALVKKARAQAGKDAPKHLAVDSQSVPSTAKGGHAGTMGARR